MTNALIVSCSARKHPTQVNLNQSPYCTLSGQRLPAHLASPSKRAVGTLRSLGIDNSPTSHNNHRPPQGRVFREPPYTQLYFLTQMCDLNQVEHLARKAKNKLKEDFSTGKII